MTKVNKQTYLVVRTKALQLISNPISSSKQLSTASLRSRLLSGLPYFWGKRTYKPNDSGVVLMD